MIVAIRPCLICGGQCEVVAEPRVREHLIAAYFCSVECCQTWATRTRSDPAQLRRLEFACTFCGGIIRVIVPAINERRILGGAFCGVPCSSAWRMRLDEQLGHQRDAVLCTLCEGVDPLWNAAPQRPCPRCGSTRRWWS